MKHWDLRPGENVTLQSVSGARRRGYFMFRDTLHAAFMIETAAGELYFSEYDLREDGELEQVIPSTADEIHPPLPARRIGWRILGADRHTRTVVDGEDNHP